MVATIVNPGRQTNETMGACIGRHWNTPETQNENFGMVMRNIVLPGPLCINVDCCGQRNLIDVGIASLRCTSGVIIENVTPGEWALKHVSTC